MLVVALVLIGFGAFLSFAEFRDWRRNQTELRLG
jgi:hypothetical protein